MPVQKTPFKLFEDFEVNDKNVVRKRMLRFDVNALADFEQETGMGFGQLMSTRAAFATARALLWAGLKHEDRTLSMEQVGILIGKYLRHGEGNTVDKLLTTCFEAMREQGAFGDMLKGADSSEEEGQGDSDKGNAPA